MVLVLFLFLLSLIIIFTFFIVLTSLITIQIDVKNFKLKTDEKTKIKTNKDFEIFIFGYIFNKIKIFKYKINDKKYFQGLQNKVDLSILKMFFSNNYNTSNIKFIEIENLNLKLKLGTENTLLTTGIVTFFSIIISIFLPKLIINFDEDKFEYEVLAVYENKNNIDLFLETKIRIRLFSIIKAFKSYNKARLMELKTHKNTKINPILIKNIN